LKKVTTQPLVPTRQRGNAVTTRQRRGFYHGTLARPEWVPTPARGNQKNFILPGGAMPLS